MFATIIANQQTAAESAQQFREQIISAVKEVREEVAKNAEKSGARIGKVESAVTAIRLKVALAASGFGIAASGLKDFMVHLWGSGNQPPTN
jgi:hypothetical protein